MSNHFVTYLVTNFLNGLMGEGRVTNTAINDVLTDNDICKKIRDLMPPIDAVFIRKMVAILGCNSNFMDAIKGLGKSGDELEYTIISMLSSRFSE